MNAILLTGAALVGLPILVHLLLRQEPKRLRFPAYHFLTQKLRTNQRKLRLRHILLLLLRMGLIALFCLALYQPVLYSERIHFFGEQPVAAVLILDTSASMGLLQEDKTRLEEARRRALEFLDELPARSAIAVITTDDPYGRWTDVNEARSRVQGLDQPVASSGSVTTALATAYQLLAKVEPPEGDDPSAWSRLIVIYTDCTTGSWDPDRTEDLIRLRDSLPDPKPVHTIIDVGVTQAVNFALTSVQMKPQIISANQPAVITLTALATGPDTEEAPEIVITAELDQGRVVQKKTLRVPYGQSRLLRYEFQGLTSGFHTVTFRIENTDRLMIDNSRYWTFQVGAARSVLTISDRVEDALFWQAAHAAKGEFDCLVVTPEQIRRTPEGRIIVEYPNPSDPRSTLQEELNRLDLITLLNVRNPQLSHGGGTLWEKLRPYGQAGGKLLIIPGPELDLDGYNVAVDLLPAQLGKVVDTRQLEPPPPPQSAPGWPEPRDGSNGVTWFLDDRTLQHPLLKDFQLWRQKGNVTEVVNPRRAWKYYDVTPVAEATVIVRYYDHRDPNQQRPAVLERGIADPKDDGKIKGRVLLLTTRLDVPSSEHPPWNDYWETEGSKWYVVFPYMLARYLAGDIADANFNYTCGDIITLSLPKTTIPRGSKVIIQGPGIIGGDQLLELGEQQTELRLGPPRLAQPGHFMVSLDALGWLEKFSLNLPAQESILERLPPQIYETLTGPNSVVTLEKNRSLREMIERTFGGPIELFPWLLLALFAVYTFEAILANRFYASRRRHRPTA